MGPSEQEWTQKRHFLAIFGVFQALPIYLGQITRNWLFAPDSKSLAQIMKIETKQKHFYVVNTQLKPDFFRQKKLFFDLGPKTRN